MTIRYNPPGAWPQLGRAFNHGVVEPEGRRLHITGEVGWDADGKIVGPGDCEAQMRQAFANVEAILATAGGRLEDIVSMTIYFLNREDLPVIQRVRAEKLSSETAPASILVQVPGLVVPDLLVELVPIAVIPHERFKDPREMDA
ncbi:MAG: RidA family protein [Pseudomonadota bacterium]